MGFPSFDQGNEFLKTRDAQKAGKQRINKHRQHRQHFTNGSSSTSSHIEAFTSNSNGATAPSTTASASSSKAPSIPAQYQYKNIQRVNRDENNVMKGVLKDVNSSVATAVTTGQDTTAIANNFVRSNDKNSLVNSNVATVNGVQGAVNAMGIFSTYPSNVASNSNANFASTDLNIPTSMALPINQNQNNQYKIISSGAPNSANTVLLGQSAQMPTVSAQNAIGSYAGQNVYIYDRNPLLGNNITYEGNYTTSLNLASNEITANTNAKQCFERAADTAAQSGYGGIWAGVDNFGNCYTGESPSGNWTQSYSKDMVLCEVFPGVTLTSAMILGANGGLYNGPPNDNDPTNKNLLNKNLDPTTLANVDPIYGVAINNVSASFGLSGGMANKNNMLFNDSVVSGADPTGQSTATFGTIRTTISPGPTICPDWWYDWWADFGFFMLDWEWARDWKCYTEEVVNYSSILQPGQSSMEDVTLTYKCGKIPKSLPPQTVYAGTDISISCFDEMSQYGIMYLQIADNGVITVTNSATGQQVWTFTPSGDQQALLNKSLTLKNMSTVRLNAPRPDWVNGSGVTSSNPNSSTALFTFPNVPNGLTTFSPGEYLSSPNGYCRLKLNENMKLVIEYSLYNLALDSSGYAAGNISNAVSPSDESYAMYYIGGIQANNLGSLSYVDMNNNVYSYSQPNGGLPLGDSYIESKNYVPMTTPSWTTAGITDPTQCANICSNYDNCGGYTIMDGECAAYTPQSLFPNANRMYQEGATTYIRDVKVTQDMTDPSCSKRVANITTDVYNNFGNYITGEPMTTDKKCGMAVVLDSEIQSLNNANANAIAKGQIIQNQMTNIYNKQNNAINDLQTNNMFSHMFEDVIQDVNKAIKKQENNAISKVAAKDNTDLILVSDNYKYIIWGIVTLLISIAAIKALRVGSS